MSTLGKYCKAFPLRQFRQFAGWAEATQNARKTRIEIDGETQEVEREFADTDYFYLQENFTVTDGIFVDEFVIFNNVTPEWIEFCQQTLAFNPEQSCEPSHTSNSN